MLGKDEQQYMELHSKLHQELHQIEQQIDELEERRDELTAVLDGSYAVSRFAEPPIPVSANDELDNLLVSFIKQNGPVTKAETQVAFLDVDIDAKTLSRSFDRCRRRGLIRVEGKAKSAVWTAD